jgi:hypothetical protein
MFLDIATIRVLLLDKGSVGEGRWCERFGYSSNGNRGERDGATWDKEQASSASKSHDRVDDQKS